MAATLPLLARFVFLGVATAQLLDLFEGEPTFLSFNIKWVIYRLEYLYRFRNVRANVKIKTN